MKIRTKLLVLACLALIACSAPAPAAAGESVDRLVRDLPEGHRQAVRERAASDDRGSRSDRRRGGSGRERDSESLFDDDDDDADSAAELVGAILVGIFSGGADRDDGAGEAGDVAARGAHELFEEEVGESGAGSAHPWMAEGEGLMSRINLGVARYDDRAFNEAASYEWQLHGRLLGTWGLGVTLGGGWGTNSVTGSLARGTLETGLVMASTNVDIPLGRGRAPILSLGGGVGGFYADPDVASDTREDLEAQGLRLDQGHHWFLDERVRADLLLPLDSEHTSFVGFGAARDWAGGTITTTMRDRATGAAVSKDTAHIDFDRTTFQISLVLVF